MIPIPIFAKKPLQDTKNIPIKDFCVLKEIKKLLFVCKFNKNGYLCNRIVNISYEEDTYCRCRRTDWL